jgi:hypothetical protein
MTNEIPSLPYIKAKAKSLKAYLSAHDPESKVSHCQCLNEAVKPYGFKSYVSYKFALRNFEDEQAD